MLLLQNSKKKDDKLYSSEVETFRFSEVNGINLGFLESGSGESICQQKIEQKSDETILLMC